MLNFQELYESHSAEVYRFALWLTGDAFEAEDITADTFVRAWARNRAIRTETLRAYLFTIARNAYLERLRKGKRQVELDDVYPDPTPGPEALLESRSELSEIKGILLTLPEIDRTAFILRVQHELPYAEIARVLDLSISAAKVKVHRVRKKLLVTILGKTILNKTTLDKKSRDKEVS
jgi:RNA polymerase sigma-70 factor (ECF subfamily)